MEVFQTAFELEQMLVLCRALKPSRVLEIGAWQGGTLVEWLKIADTVVVIDDAMRSANDWEHAARQEDTDLHLLKGRSQDGRIVERADELGPYDWLFIDADHTYEAVKADWENYGPMVRDGGAVAFHDILHRPDYGVDRVWNEIKGQDGALWVEIARTSSPNLHGIGIVWV